MANTDNDKFAKKLALETLENSFGSARVRAVARAEFLNGVDIAHGGFLFTVADFASALAVNTDERVAVSSGASINYLSPCPKDEIVIAIAKVSYSDSRTALCDVSIESEATKRVFAIFQARLIFKKQ